MISGFREDMNRWMSEHSIKTEQDLNELQEFIQNHLLTISQEDARSYLPQLTSQLSQVQVDHPLIKKMQDIRANLLSSQAKTLQDLPQDVLLHILQQKGVLTLTNAVQIAKTHPLLSRLVKHPLMIKKLLEEYR